MSYMSDEHVKIQAALHYLANRRVSLRNWTVICKEISGKKISCDSDEYSLSGVLYYIMDGFLPMMRKFLKLCWVEKTCAHNPVLGRPETQLFSELKCLGDGVEVNKSKNCCKVTVTSHKEFLQNFLSSRDGPEIAQEQGRDERTKEDGGNPTSAKIHCRYSIVFLNCFIFLSTLFLCFFHHYLK